MGFTTITDPVTGELREVDFKRWMSITWANIVNHPHHKERRKHAAAGTGVDYAEVTKLTNPRRMAIYFAKYGTGSVKDYQHRVPDECIDSHLICDHCGTDYDQDRDECPDCGCLNAQLINTGGAG